MQGKIKINLFSIAINSKEIPEQKEEESAIYDVLEEARKMKKEVLNILEEYQRMFQLDQKTLRERIPKDIQRVSQQLNLFLETKAQREYQNTEVESIIALVHEFLSKMVLQKRLKKATTQPPLTKQQSGEPSFDSDQTSFQVKDPQKLIQTIDIKITSICKQLESVKELDGFLKLAKQVQANKMEVFRIMRKQYKQMDEQMQKQVSKLLKACYLKMKVVSDESTQIPPTSPRMQDEKKRRFFDEVLKVKFQLSRDDPAQKIMISQLYEEMLEQRVNEEDWGLFIKQKFKL